MAIIKCKMCGGDMELSPDKSFGTCEYCGSTMTMPKVDDEQRAAAFNRGNHFRRIGEFDKALAVYERIVQEDEEDAEAHWCCALCRFGIEYVKDPASGEYLPTCHRASFDSFLEDVDYQAALRYADAVAKKQYEKDGEQIAQVQRGILAISQKEQPFDVFLCYKENDDAGNRTVDSTLAQEIYYELTEQGRRVFFARITLEDKAGQEYEPYIFAALHSAKVMVVVGTKPEYLNAVWVKNEWSRYLSLMKTDRKRLLIPCYRDMDPYDLPEQLSVLQAYDMAKIGFLQDLTRGISKVLDADKKAETPKAAEGAANPNVDSLLKRGRMALEDGEWNSANGYFDRVLDADAECAAAYWGKMLAACRCATAADFVAMQKKVPADQMEQKEACPVDRARIDKAVAAYAAPPFVEEKNIRSILTAVDRIYDSAVAFRQKTLEEKERMLSQHKYFSRAVRFASGALADTLADVKNQILGYYRQWVEEAKSQEQENCEQAKKDYAVGLDEMEEKIAELYRDARKKQEDGYRNACETVEKHRAKTCTTPEEFRAEARVFDAAANVFEKTGDYKDCAEKIQECKAEAQRYRQLADEAEARIKREAEEKEKAEEAARQKKKKKTTAIVCGVLIVVVAITLLLVKVILPGNQYKEAESLLAAGDAEGAIAAFEDLGGYKDAAERALGIRYDQAAALEEEGQTAKAAMAFYALGDFQDAWDRSMALWDIVAVRDTIDGYTSWGHGHSVGLKNDGTTVTAGYDEYGQCSDTDSWSDLLAISVGDHLTMGLTSDHTVLEGGFIWQGSFAPEDGWTDIVAISVGGEDNAVGLRADGTVVATGREEDHAGVDEWTDIVAISAGPLHTVGLKADGTVVATGDGDDGKTNVDGVTDVVAISAGMSNTLMLKSDGTVVAVGRNRENMCDEISTWTDIVAISTGDSYALGLKSDGTVVAAGYNTDNQRDVGGWTDIVAISACESHSMGLKSDGTVVATGYNADGQCNVSDWSDIRLPR